jgi:hypothetical protein
MPFPGTQGRENENKGKRRAKEGKECLSWQETSPGKLCVKHKVWLSRKGVQK